MAERLEVDTRVSPEGRVVIPAEVRRRLGVASGDWVRFVVLADGRVELVTPRLLAEALWANNHGGGAIDSTEVVRTERLRDQHAAAAAEARMTADFAADHAQEEGVWDEAAATERLMRELGIAE